MNIFVIIAIAFNALMIFWSYKNAAGAGMDPAGSGGCLVAFLILGGTLIVDLGVLAGYLIGKF